VNTSSTFIPSAAPIRAKLNTINPINARSRRPAGVVISMLSISVRASSGASTGVKFLCDVLNLDVARQLFQPARLARRQRK
jgi:hypothetical protein